MAWLARSVRMAARGGRLIRFAPAEGFISTTEHRTEEVNEENRNRPCGPGTSRRVRLGPFAQKAVTLGKRVSEVAWSPRSRPVDKAGRQVTLKRP